MRTLVFFPAFVVAAAIVIYGCSSAQGNQAPPPPPALPVLQLNPASTTTYTEFSASLEGKTNVEIRPQVSGYLSKIYVEEGAYVTAGQPLFKIDDRPYGEQVNNAQANVLAAKANLAKRFLRLLRVWRQEQLVDVAAKEAVSLVKVENCLANALSECFFNAEGGVFLGQTAAGDLLEAPPYLR